MTATAAALPQLSSARFGPASMVWPLAAMAMVLALQLSMVFTRSVNWDEFWFYYHVAEFGRGNLSQPLQSLHVRLFAWLPGVPGNSIDHILTGRLAMLVCEMATMGAIYCIARRFAGQAASLLAALAYVTAGFVFQHGFSFRTDPMAAALLMWALAILLRARLSVVALASFALLVALATMITIKVILYAPAFIGIAWLRWSESGRTMATAARLMLAGFATLACFAVLYWWHSQDLTAAASGAGMATAAGNWMFFIGVPPYWQMILKAVAISPVLVVLIAASPTLIGRSSLSLAEKLSLGGLWLPVLTPAFYTNTAGYFYVFMLAPVAAACVLAIEAGAQRYTVRLISLVLLLITCGLFVQEDRQVITRQRSIAEAAAQAFPQPVAYFDHNGMLPSFDKANYLMTPSGLDAYRAAGVASYRAEMERRAVPLLLANDAALTAMLEGDDSVLLPADAAALRSSYIPLWGPLRIAGVDLQAGDQRVHEFLVPGTYTVTGAAITIDGAQYLPGSRVEITRGSRVLSAADGDTRLVWGQNAPQINAEWSEGPIYVDF